MSEQRGIPIVVSGPSGVGKTTITQALVKQLDAYFSVSMTTRPKTAADREGIDYFFVNEDQFKQAIEASELLEWAMVFDRYYGTPRDAIVQQLDAGRDAMLDVDVEGGKQVKAAMPESLTIFILPPQEDALLTRLRRRRREEEDVIQRRFREAKREIAEAKACGAYDHFIVNDELDRAIAEAMLIIRNRKQSADAS